MRTLDKKKQHYVSTIATEEEIDIIKKVTGEKHTQDALRKLIEEKLK